MADTYLEEISLDAIRPDPEQPRNLPLSLEELQKEVEAGDRRAREVMDGLLELSTNILEVELQQPITVYPAGENGKYIIYDGHRRWLALSLLHQQGKIGQVVHCYVRPNPETEEDALLGRMGINMQREDFNVFELARSLKQVHKSLKEKGGEVNLVREGGAIETVTLEVGEPDDVIWGFIEKKMGISRSRRYQIQAVLKLPGRIQRIAEEAAVPESKLRYLVPIDDEHILEILIHEIVEKNLSNAEIKKRIAELLEQSAEPPAPAMPKPVQIRSRIKLVRELAAEVAAVENVPAAISEKDPRTVRQYKKVFRELMAAREDLDTIIGRLAFLGPE